MRYLIFDTETTDLISNSLLPLDKQPRIIEFFGHIVDHEGRTSDALEFVCNPGIRIEKKTTEITGIKQEDLRWQPRWAHFADDVEKLIASADAVVAHNLSYDWDMVNFEFMRMKRDPATLPWPAMRICTVQETEWFKGHRLSLSALHKELFGEEFEGAHRARVDVEALTRCFMELLRRGDV